MNKHEDVTSVIVSATRSLKVLFSLFLLLITTCLATERVTVSCHFEAVADGYKSFSTDGFSLDENKGLIDISWDLRESSVKDLDAFEIRAKSEAAEELEDYLRISPDTVEHDFCLTRNGHGVGFWSRNVDRFPGLTKIAESFGEVNAYVNSETGEVEA